MPGQYCNLYWEFCLFQDVSLGIGLHGWRKKGLWLLNFLATNSPFEKSWLLEDLCTWLQIHEQITQQEQLFAASSTYHYASLRTYHDQFRTLKYLQYEFFATSAHSISGVLPVRMEFRPMVEMTPEHLEAQVADDTPWVAEWFKCSVIKGGLCWDTHSLLYLLVYVFNESSVFKWFSLVGLVVEASGFVVLIVSEEKCIHSVDVLYIEWFRN